MSAGGFFSAAATFQGMADSMSNYYGAQRVTQARLDAANAIGRDADGFIKPITLYEPGNLYGDAYNQVALTSYVAAAKNSFNEGARQAAVRNQSDPDAFKAWGEGWISRQLSDAPPELQGALRLDLTEVAGQYTASIMANQIKQHEQKRIVELDTAGTKAAQDLYGTMMAGDTAGAAKHAMEAESYAQAFEGMGEYKQAAALRTQVQRIQKFAPVLGQGLDVFNRAEGMSANDTPISAYKRVVRAQESGGNDAAKNPNSSATGRYQFTEETWADEVRNNHPDLAAGKTDAEIAALRSDPVAQERVMDTHTERNYQYLRGKGVTNIQMGELYLAHFAGAEGAASILKADRSTPITQVYTSTGKPVGSEKVLKANAKVSFNGKAFKDFTAGDLHAWATASMQKRVQELAARGEFGSGSDAMGAYAAHVQADPGKFGLSMEESLSLSGMLRNMGATLSQAKVAQASTKEADERYDYGIAQKEIKAQIDTAAQTGADPKQLLAHVSARADDLAKRYRKDPDALTTEFNNYIEKAYRDINEDNDTLKRITFMRQNGAAVENSEKNRGAIDRFTKRVFGRELSIFDPQQHAALANVIQQTGIVPSLAAGQLKEIKTLSDASDPRQVQAMAAAQGFLQQISEGKGGVPLIAKLQDVVDRQDVDRIVELMGKPPETAVKLNEMMTRERVNTADHKARALAALGATPKERSEKLNQIVQEETTPGMFANAMASMFSLGGDNAVSRYFAPKYGSETLAHVYDEALANLDAYTNPRTAVQAALGATLKGSAMTTYMRGPMDDMTPKVRFGAPEAYYDPVVFKEDLAKFTFNELQKLKVSDTSWAKDIGQMMGAAAAAIQNGVVNGPFLDKLLEGGLPPIDKELTMTDVKNMISSGVIDVRMSRLPTKDAKPGYTVVASIGSRMLPPLTLDFRPEDRPGRTEVNGRDAAAFAQRFWKDTGVKLPSVLVGLGASAYSELQNSIIDPIMQEGETIGQAAGNLAEGATEAYEALRQPGPTTGERWQRFLGQFRARQAPEEPDTIDPYPDPTLER